jgi:hypothetical protein
MLVVSKCLHFKIGSKYSLRKWLGLFMVHTTVEVSMELARILFIFSFVP